ncbi:uncharacterized protein METZ01_LOCUS508266, partial [marine metagenome]
VSLRINKFDNLQKWLNAEYSIYSLYAGEYQPKYEV